jgi:hypothetical protein
VKPITDRAGKVLAYEQDVNNHRQEIRSRSNALLGWYDPELNKTFNRSGRCVSNSGDTRASLIPPSE